MGKPSIFYRSSIHFNYQGEGGPLCPNCSAALYRDSFACSYGARGNWSDGIQSFQDPTPPNSIITNVTATLYHFGLGKLSIRVLVLSFTTTYIWNIWM